MMADNRRGTNDDAGAVVNSKVLADAGSRMDVDACGRMGQLRYKTRQDGNAQAEKPVGRAVMQHGRYTGIAGDDFLAVGRCRVVAGNGIHVGKNQPPDFRHLVHEGLCFILPYQAFQQGQGFGMQFGGPVKNEPPDAFHQMFNLSFIHFPIRDSLQKHRGWWRDNARRCPEAGPRWSCRRSPSFWLG